LSFNLEFEIKVAIELAGIETERVFS